MISTLFGSFAVKCCRSLPCRSNTPNPSPSADLVVVMTLLWSGLVAWIQTAGSSPSPPLASVSYLAFTATKEQSGPVQPFLHLHTFGPSHLPWPEQSFLQVVLEQSLPVKPAKHWHPPDAENPFSEHFLETTSSHLLQIFAFGLYPVFALMPSGARALAKEPTATPASSSFSNANAKTPAGCPSKDDWKIESPPSMERSAIPLRPMLPFCLTSLS